MSTSIVYAYVHMSLFIEPITPKRKIFEHAINNNIFQSDSCR